jgi:hypothetical protein
MSDGSEVCGCGGRGEGRGAGRGTADGSAGGREGSTGAWELDGFKPSGFEPGDFAGVADGLGVLAGSAFSIRFAFGVSFSGSVFFFEVGVLSGSDFGLFWLEGVSLVFAFGFGVTSSSWSLLFLADDFAFGLGVGDSSSSSPEGVFFGRGVFVGSGVSVGFAFGFGVGVAFFFVFDFRFAGFGFGFGSGVSEGVGEVTARISSRAFFFFGSSVDWARTNAPRIAAKRKTVPRKTRSRITGRERNRAGCVINSRKLSGSSGLWHRLGEAGGALAFAAQDRVQFSAEQQQ